MKRLIFFFLVVLFVASPFVVLPRLVKVKTVSCQSQYGPCSKLLDDKVASVDKNSLYVTKKALKKILLSEAQVSTFSFHFKFPDRLEVNLLERKAEFAISFNDKAQTALVNKEGYILAFGETTSLPFLVDNEVPPNVGEKINEKKLFALRVVGDMFTNYQIRKGQIENNSLEFKLNSGQTVIFPLEGDRQLLVAALNTILAKLKASEDEIRIENGSRPVNIIDLRFKNPVLR